MGQINIGGTKAVQLKGYTDASITSDQAFTFPDTGGELVTAPLGGQVVCYQQGTWTVTVNNGSCTTLVAMWSRIGNRVQGTARVGNFTNTTASGTLTVEAESLPYLPVQTDHLLAVGSCYVKKISRQPNVTATTGTGDIQFVATAADSDSDISRPRYADINDTGAFLAFDFSYLTDDTTWQPTNGATIQ